VSQDRQVSAIGGVLLLLDGVPQPNLIHLNPANPAVLLLDMTGIGQKVLVSATVSGAGRGTILLQKM
jgi:hypothetical protein